MAVYITNSPGIFTTEKELVVTYFDMTDKRKQFCDWIRDPNAISAVGHPGAADMINKICGTDIEPNRIQIDLKPGDASCGITLNFRPEPGKEYTKEEMEELIREGKVKLYCIVAEPSTREAMQKLMGYW